MIAFELRFIYQVVFISGYCHKNEYHHTGAHMQLCVHIQGYVYVCKICMKQSRVFNIAFSSLSHDHVLRS